MMEHDPNHSECPGCASRKKTIEVLMNTVERQQSGVNAQGTAYQVFQQTLSLERIVEEKTQALASTVSKLGNAQAQLLSAQKLEAVGQLAAGVAHEINTPMQYIGDNTRFLQKAFTRIMELADAITSANDSPESKAALEAAIKRARIDFLKKRVPRAIEQAIEGVDAVSKIVSAMKEFSHPGSEDKVATDLNHVLETTRTVSRNEWKYVADVELDLGPLPLVPALPGGLGQVFLNIIVNAAHAIADKIDDEEKGTIAISTRATDGFVEVVVRDTGGGIPPEIQAKVFEPFFTTKEVGKGTGQGLAIARSIIVDKHDGQISVESIQGEGARFTVLLPLHESKEEAA